ncbi:MAG: hypothetical protein GWP91_21060 [Rhodobacterales bacterium]|nr:hypothetical protein [Rhodobacterales bacterium]
MIPGSLACIAVWGVGLAWAQPGVVVLEHGGESTVLASEITTELALAAPGLSLIEVQVDDKFIGFSADEQVRIAAQSVQAHQTDAAVWLHGDQVSIWWPAGDRAVTVAVTASTEQPASELALVVIRQLDQVDLYDLASAPEAAPKMPPMWTMAVLGHVQGDLRGSAAARVGIAWLAERNIGRARVGLSGGQRWGRARSGVPAVTAMQASHVDLHGSFLWGEAVQWGPSLGIRAAQNQVSIQLEPGLPDATTGAFTLQVVPGARLAVGAGSLAGLLLVEAPVAMRQEIWRYDGRDILLLGPSFMSMSAGLAWQF